MGLADFENKALMKVDVWVRNMGNFGKKWHLDDLDKKTKSGTHHSFWILVPPLYKRHLHAATSWGRFSIFLFSSQTIIYLNKSSTFFIHVAAPLHANCPGFQNSLRTPENALSFLHYSELYANWTNPSPKTLIYPIYNQELKREI